MGNSSSKSYATQLNNSMTFPDNASVWLSNSVVILPHAIQLGQLKIGLLYDNFIKKERNILQRELDFSAITCSYIWSPESGR